MRQRVYIETSIPSLYYETRTDAESVAKRGWTRQWWDGERDNYEIFTSAAVDAELRRGEYPARDLCLALLEAVPRLPVSVTVNDIVATYISHKVMPADTLGDALHLALASVHHCDFLLTWNCRHLANANKFQHIAVVNTLMGLPVPVLATPFQLLREDDDAGTR